MLYIYSFGLPILVIIFVELIGLSTLSKVGPVKVCNVRIPAVVVNIYFLYIGCLFGSATSQCITDICKYTIGRLRPHFIDVCNPDFSKINCTNADGLPRYVTDFSLPWTRRNSSSVARRSFGDFTAMFRPLRKRGVPSGQ